ncbi:hypothetical protein BDZ89DRAFT_1009358 [Hymenopellis radicata]|nr:hypothetical protein BDZ89DRAFT_1009358 [Hymenopellis radicata]
MIFKISILAIAAAFLVGVNAVADNPVDACNGSNHYGVGHSCAFAHSQGSKRDFTACQYNACGNLICIPH